MCYNSIYYKNDNTNLGPYIEQYLNVMALFIFYTLFYCPKEKEKWARNEPLR